MSKGYKNNRIKDWVKYWEEHDSIFKKESEFVDCEECGQSYKKSEHLKYMKYEHGCWVCKGSCNYN